jgi:signal peptidase I
MKTWLRILAWVGGVLGIVAAVLYFFVFDVWTIPSDDPMEAASIEPNVSTGDVVLLSKHTTVARGNLLRCADPQAPGRFVVARAVAMGNERIDLRDEAVMLDGHRQPSPRACDQPRYVLLDPQSNEDVEMRCSIEEFGEREFGVLAAMAHPEPPTTGTVEAGRWYLVSDDRHIHVDSRDFGTIDPATCEHVVFRLQGRKGFGDSKTRLTIIW